MQNQNVIKTFKQICQIPHCSYHTEKLGDFLIALLKELGCEVSVDEERNIYAYKGKPKLCLQAHYDMVCVGNAPKIDVVKKDGFLFAKNSTLGADDGIGVAIALEMLREFDDLEVIFTNNEEVGLMGASNCNFKTKSKKLLNLDSESDDSVIVGCAGGVDIMLHANFKSKKEKLFFYEISLSGLPGGHSGLDITKNRPNAIKELAKFIYQNRGYVAKFSGGERRNSIPVGAFAVVGFEKELKENSKYQIKALGLKDDEVLDDDFRLLKFICTFAQGVRSYDESVGSAQDSINLSVLNATTKEVSIQLFPRSMSKEGLENTKFETELLAETFGFKTAFANQTPPWQPILNDFSHIVLDEFAKIKKDVKFEAVHAGLECGILMEKDKELHSCSIGPNIYGPHSINEKVELASVALITDVVRAIIKRV